MLTRLADAQRSLEETYAAQRRFVADVSHELRTPLTTIRGNLELLKRLGDDADARREILTDVVSEAERLSRFLNNLLTLARADGDVMSSKKWLVLVLTAVVLTAIAAGASYAAAPAPERALPMPGWCGGHDTFLNKLAARLHVERAQLDEAIKDAAGQTLDEAVQQDRLMPQQAERLRAGLERGRFCLARA